MAMVYKRRSVDARLWQQMPFELVERVLSFLGPPDLCRCRPVCRRWDYLICTPRFGALARGHPGYIVVLEQDIWEDTGENIAMELYDEPQLIIFRDHLDLHSV
ncbi:hypothetical protein KC19_4G023100 [Ceratodon purpureus]|uniref:F-box domain-containing protein n=1 Tax=Ceratodon purpureus TaxID=3225 RepID=A0A8T0I4L6_CERPU|nr:hypothetical protein KC19_4G023100 [Ceratodon purpureus]